MTWKAFIRKSAILLSLWAAFSSIGGAWMIAQSVAWSQMIVAYSHQDDLAHGLKKTFDGKHPCKICHNIAQQRESHSKSNRAVVQLKFETYTLVRVEAKPLRDLTVQAFSPLRFPDLLTVQSTPPLPPPRRAFA